MIPVSELARRLCLAEHTLYLTSTDPTARSAPCARHVEMARRLIPLIGATGAPALKVLLDAAQQEAPDLWPETATA